MVVTENVKNLSDLEDELRRLTSEIRLLRFVVKRQSPVLYGLLKGFYSRMTADLVQVSLRRGELGGLEGLSDLEVMREPECADRLEHYRAASKSVVEKLDSFLDWHDGDVIRTNELSEPFADEKDTLTQAILLVVSIHQNEGFEKLALLSLDPDFRSS